MKDIVLYVAVVNRKAQLTGNELFELAEMARQSPNVTGVKVKKSNITFNATPDEVERLRAKFEDKVIIEVNKEIYPLR